MQQAEGGGVGVRAILAGGKQGYSYTTAIEQPAVEEAARKALAGARVLPADPCRKLPDRRGRPQTGAEGLSDPAAFSQKVTSLQDKLRAYEDRLLRSHPLLKSVLRAGFSEGASDSAIVNSKGVEEATSGTHVGLGVSCLAEKDGERQEGGYGQTKRFQEDLDWDDIFARSARRTLALLGGRPIASGRWPVVFDPSVGCEFLSLVSGMVSADSVQKGKSPFRGKLGETVASSLVSLTDDGTLNRGLATSPVDDEGVPTQKTAVVEAGRLARFLYDTYSAEKDGARSTGNASRAGFKSSPVSGCSNFFLHAGTRPPADLLRETEGLYLYDVMGLHMADPISGDFSVAAIGSWLKNGEFQYGVRGITLAGNLLDVLRDIDAVADDLTFFGSLGSPSFRVRAMNVSGQG